MKHIILLMSLMSLNMLIAQEHDSGEARSTIDTFFKGFHAQDSLIMTSVMHEDMTLRSITTNNSGQMVVTQATSGQDFVASILSIPKNIKFEERILDYQIMVDGAMALVWTPYELYFDGKMSHCGVNNFTLFKNGGTWEILTVVDTRRKSCNP